MCGCGACFLGTCTTSFAARTAEPVLVIELSHVEARLTILPQSTQALTVHFVVLQVFGGHVLCTFKLHLAAVHLPDQVRSSGASFFCLEYWVERMVQVYKRMIKYRSTAFPELLFINSYLLRRACLQILRTAAGAQLVCMAIAVKAARERRKQRRRRAVARQADAMFLGAPKPVADAERLQVMPAVSPSRPSGLTGLPYLLFSDRSLGGKGWPTYDALPAEAGRTRMGMILRALGIGANNRPGEEGVIIDMQKYVRAELPVGDTVSCVQCTSQSRKDNSWCYIVYQQENGPDLSYVGQLQFFVMATLETSDGFNIAKGCNRQAEPLRLAVVNLYACEFVGTPGCRDPDSDLGRPPEFIRVTRSVPPGGGPSQLPFQGQWVVELDTLSTQLVPTRQVGRHRYFMWANKASGRSNTVRL